MTRTRGGCPGPGKFGLDRHGARFVRVFGQLNFIHRVSGARRRPHRGLQRDRGPPYRAFGIAHRPHPCTVFHRISATPPRKRRADPRPKRASCFTWTKAGLPLRRRRSAGSHCVCCSPLRMGASSRVPRPARPHRQRAYGGRSALDGRIGWRARVHRRAWPPAARPGYFGIGGTVSDPCAYRVRGVLVPRSARFGSSPMTRRRTRRLATVVVIWFPGGMVSRQRRRGLRRRAHSLSPNSRRRYQQRRRDRADVWFRMASQLPKFAITTNFAPT